MRIITKYARMYLKTVFSTVHTVNGKTTDDFRRCWGVEKSRDNHAHHTVDAIVVACATREQYDRLAQYYHDYESYDQNDPAVPEKPHFPKPWKTFTEDMNELKNQIIVSHYAPNHLLKQTRKHAKVRGKKVVQQGKTARGSLHQDTFYGAIKRLEKNEKTGETTEITRYVVRKALADLSDADMNKIVDERVRDISVAGRKEEVCLKKRIDALKKKNPTSDAVTEEVIQKEIEALELQRNGLYTLPNKNGTPVPIKKVRIYSNLTNPIELKAQWDKSTKGRRPHKEHYYVNNDSNYVLEIFDGEKRREFELYKNIEAVNGKISEVHGDAVSLKKGQHVLLYKETPSEVWNCTPAEIIRRFYVVQGLSSMTIQKKFKYGIVVLMHASEGRRFTDLKVQDGDFDPEEPYMPLRKFLHTRFKALVEGRDFTITSLGELRKV
jgi:CRISPR-associated endonuclease Csn1